MLKLGELVEATGGSLLRGDPSAVLGAFEIDSRKLRAGGVFVALRGTQRDGHEFLAEAARAGAAAALIGRELQTDELAPPSLVRVEDTAAALARSAGWMRRKLSAVRWIALTGSNGKTTTKELLAAGLSATRRVHRTAGNLNNQLGVPLTLLACPADAEVAVIELAMSAPGEIAELTRLVDPDVGLVTNVRAVHLQFFSSLDDIAAAKGELFALLRREATAVVNLDDPHVRVQAARHEGRRVTFGQHVSADVRLEDVENRFLPGAALTYRYRDTSRRLQLRLGGGHAALDALAALAAVAAAGEDPHA
ncbi:MAG TPA: UDP-N-acetylmuramoyl-tripeptide--D-alanyl-D-alanine ligase, partial [Candidatus Polarisedimenticolaceae bacterium]|nr:UDP-N-acetylmuramoyl-tripeptide--D-alanyl-D-alanine ligase [Candidatus Polarisedimenticolaceae bacterium]